MKPKTAKSLALVVAAVLIGLGVLSAGYDNPETSLSSANAEPEPAPADQPTPTPDVVNDALTAASSVNVLVANATGVEGLAGLVSERLETGSGYTLLPATNAAADVNGLTTAVYYAGGTEADARGVAMALNLDPDIVLRIPSPAPVTDPTGAHVVVIVGDDLAPAG